MTDGRHRILLVEPNAEVVEILVASLARRFDAQITCVADGASALDADFRTPQDLVISEVLLDDCDGLQLVQQLCSLCVRPIILLADEPSSDDAIEAMRTGVRDMYVKPFAVEDLLDSAERLLRGNELRRAHLRKHHRMRHLVRRVLRERRDLKRRTELICRDLVEAHRRLVHRVLETGS